MRRMWETASSGQRRLTDPFYDYWSHLGLPCKTPLVPQFTADSLTIFPERSIVVCPLVAVILDLMNEVTRIFTAEDGDPTAAEKLLPLVYTELRQLAARKLSREKPGQTLDATGLVHEAYLRLLGRRSPSSYKDRGHFFAAAASAMRRILIDRARRKQTQKHGGGLKRQRLESVGAQEPDEDLLLLDEALKKLAHSRPGWSNCATSQV
jgi:RNA polymerase sigma factor (TIGR02999 family)